MRLSARSLGGLGMSSEWVEYRLGDIASLSWGDTKTTKSSYIDKGYPAYSASGKDGFLPHYDYDRVGVVLSAIGADCGRTWLAREKWSCIKNTMKFWAISEEVETEYLYLITASKDFWPKRGSAQPFISQTDARNLLVRIPSKKTQRAIWSVVSHIDERIALLRETNATLEAIAQALFKSWFVEFDPVHAKANGLAPAGMDEATAALFPDGFEDSELGQVPRGWHVIPVGNVVECVGGTTPDTKNERYWSPAEYAWTTPKDLSGLPSPVLLRSERMISAQGLARIGSGLLPSGTLLLSSRAPIGYLAISQIPVAINQGYIAIPPGGRVPPLYLLFWCQQNMEIIKARANGSTFMEISKKAFRPIPMLTPPQQVVTAFDEIASPIFAKIVENERQSHLLATLRDTLLPRLISGKLRIPEAEAVVEEALQ